MNRFLQLCVFVLSISFLVPVAGAQATRFKATLSGADQVPAVDTTAAGTATFRLNAAGDTLNYTINVTGIQDPAAAHIHMAAAGKNGPPVVVLYPSDANPAQTGAFTGVLAKGSITAASLVGPLAGKTLADLVEQIKAGNTYVNVHTKAHGGGEIRGQIQ